MEDKKLPSSLSSAQRKVPMKKFSMAVGAAIALAGVTAPAQAQVNFTYSTRGCFGSSCTVNAGSALQASHFANPGTVYFTGVNGVTAGPTNSNGYVAATNFGSFTFSSASQKSEFEDLTFKLYIDITAPSIAHTTFLAELEGELKKNSVTGELEVDWARNYSDALQYDPDGAYRVFVKDIDDDDYEQSYTLSGAFDCSPGESTYDDDHDDDDGDHHTKYSATKSSGAGCAKSSSPNIQTTVPEPSTYALMGAGLLGIFGFARRRNRNA